MAGSAYFMPAGDEEPKKIKWVDPKLSSRPMSDKIRWNDYNKIQHEKALQRRAYNEKIKLRVEGTKLQRNIELRQQQSAFKQAQRAQEQQAFDTSWMGKSARNAELAAQNVGQFAGVASGGQNFGPEQRALREMFGHGESMWNLPDSQPVTISNNLHPSLNGDDRTAGLFGFGRNRERSGLF